MTVLKDILSVIVYAPLIIIGLVILWALAYGIWVRRSTGNWPPMYGAIGNTILFVLIKLLIPLKLLGQFFWWLLPIFPDKYRVPLGYTRFGAWDSVNLARSLLLVTLIAFITISSLILKYGYPNALVTYSNILNIGLIALGMIFFILLYIVFSSQIMAGGGPGGVWPTGGTLDAKTKWLFSSGGNILWFGIATAVVLALLGVLCYFIAKYSIFSIGGLSIIMILAGLAALFLIYSKLTTIPGFNNFLQNNSFFKMLFYTVFILPCLFSDTIRFLYNQLRHTPQTVYAVLFAEIVIITLYIILPMFQKYIYTLMPPKDNKLIIIKTKINEIETNKAILKKRIKKIKQLHPPNGKMLDDNGWDNIISHNLNNVNNEVELTNLLINYGYVTKQMCEDNSSIKNKDSCAEDIKIMINNIQQKTGELVGLQSKLKDGDLVLKKLEKEKNRVNAMERGKILLMNPVYLKTKKFLGGYTDFKMDGNDVEYNYNYGISAWFFIRAQPPSYGASYNKYTSILNYGDKPNILYNGAKNTLQIKMNNGKDKKPIIYEIKKFPLQKWNNVVVNYDGGILDIFMNSKLVASISNVIPYMSMDQLTAGDDNGIGGGVCNIVYFPSVMSKERIDLNYRILRNKNPPVL